MAQRSKSNFPTFRSAPVCISFTSSPPPAMGVVATVGEEEEACVPICVHTPILGRALGHARDLGSNRCLGPHDRIGDATLTSLQGMVRSGGRFVVGGRGGRGGGRSGYRRTSRSRSPPLNLPTGQAPVASDI